MYSIVLDIIIGAASTGLTRCHGDMGLLLFDCLCIAMLLGTYQLFGMGYAWTCICISIMISWLSTHLQMKRKGPETSTTHAFVDDKDVVKGPMDGEDAYIHANIHTNIHANIHTYIHAKVDADGFGDDGFDDYDAEAPEQEHLT
jgi:hypothetical protein